MFRACILIGGRSLSFLAPHSTPSAVKIGPWSEKGLDVKRSSSSRGHSMYIHIHTMSEVLKFGEGAGQEGIRKKNTLKRLVSGTEMKRRLRNIDGFILGNEKRVPYS